VHILVLGATGFIGSHIARAAVERGHTVRAFSRPSSDPMALEGLDVDRAFGDIESVDSLIAAMEGCQAVVHAAGYYPATATPRAVHCDRARRQIQNVLQAAREAGVRRLVYTSSISTIGPIPPGRLGTEADHYWPGQMHHPYWDCKWIQEQAVLSAPDLEAIALIPSAVFGPGDVKPTTGTLLLAIDRIGARVAVNGRVNVVDVRDVAHAHVVALTRGRPGERYLIGGHNITVPEALRAAAHALGCPGPMITLPAFIFRWPSLLLDIYLTRRGGGPTAAAYFLEALGAHQWIDATKAVRELNLHPRPLKHTFADAVSWFREHGYFDRPLGQLMKLS